MASAPTESRTIDREKTTPFHLKLFYRQNGFHHLSDFPIPSSSSNSLPLPPHVQIYTWPSCTLRELGHLLTSALPSLLPDPVVGTRLSFRLVFPDTRSHGGAARLGGEMGAAGETRGRYQSRELGSVIVGASEETQNKESEGPSSIRLQGQEADTMLQDVRFVIGDYVDCAIFAPLPDGSAAPIAPRAPNFSTGGGMRAFGGGPLSRDSGFGRPRQGVGPSGRSGGGPGNPSGPSGEWRRGERVPDTGRRFGGRGGGGHGSRLFKAYILKGNIKGRVFPESSSIMGLVSQRDRVPLWCIFIGFQGSRDCFIGTEQGQSVSDGIRPLFHD
ncbi:hypothetical protein FQN57_000211 [Myotisia sp. PD_48]|nr:hypothetical protein FQN57_000211 [Myotisia sp. PD_48]